MEQITPKLKSWASIMEQQARQQAIETASMDFVQPYMAVMPDIHYGRGCCVGAVIPTVGAIIPAAVGVDIGCGMIAVRTQFAAGELHKHDLADLRQRIEQAIPLSAGGCNATLESSARGYVEELERTPGAKQATAANSERYPWHLQLGTLGSGNHFIEVCLDEDNGAWLFLHSGSRGIGNRLARHHINIAMEQCRGLRLPNRDLAYLEEGTEFFGDYIRDLRWAQRYAFLNRKEMMNRVVREFSAWIGLPVKRLEEINCHHNYTVREEISGREFWLSRKGAIDAHEGVMGLIPGSMGDASYVVRGKGNAEALFSSPHGAGRRFSRGEAKRTFTPAELEKEMQGIEWNKAKARVFLDESPHAYKPIGQIMRDSEDLVEIVHTLHQVVNVKGD